MLKKAAKVEQVQKARLHFQTSSTKLYTEAARRYKELLDDKHRRAETALEAAGDEVEMPPATGEAQSSAAPTSAGGCQGGSGATAAASDEAGQAGEVATVRGSVDDVLYPYASAREVMEAVDKGVLQASTAKAMLEESRAHHAAKRQRTCCTFFL